MLQAFRIVVGIMVILGVVNAMPNVCHVVNDALASARIDTTPFCSIDHPVALVAQGSVVSLTGYDLGPVEEEVSPGFPLRTNLSGVSVRLRVGAASLDAFILSIHQNRIRVLIPSRTPQGEGAVVVTRDGQTSNAYRVHVVERHLRLYAAPPQALAYNVSADGEWRANRFSSPSRPGQLLVLWGTGLGPAEGDESAGLLPLRDGGAAVEVLLALKPARVHYAGRSGCCPGLDQIVIETPQGIEGCAVPVVTRFPGDEADIDHGLPTVAVSSKEGFCSDPQGLSEDALRRMEAGGTIKTGRVWLGPAGWWIEDGIAAVFSGVDVPHVLPAGSCGDARWGPRLQSGSAFLDAGSNLTFAGPSGTRAVPHHEDYNAELVGSLYVTSMDSRNLLAGSYEIHNGNGGAQVGPFRLPVPITGSSIEWTNRGGLEVIRGADVTVTWEQTGAPEDGLVRISGNFLTFRFDQNGYGLGGFTCLEEAGRGKFTVPAWLMWTWRSNPAGVLELSLTYFTRRSFSAPGLDYGEFVHTKSWQSSRKPIH